MHKYKRIWVITDDGRISLEPEDFFTITSSRIVGRSDSGYPITGLRLSDKKGKLHVAYHIVIGKVTEIFYAVGEAAKF